MISTIELKQLQKNYRWLMFKEILTYVVLNNDKIEGFHPTVRYGKNQVTFKVKGSNNIITIQTVNDTTFVQSIGSNLFTTVTEDVINFLEKEFEHYHNIQLRGGDGLFMSSSTVSFFD